MNKPVNRIEKLIEELCPQGVDFGRWGRFVLITIQRGNLLQNLLVGKVNILTMELQVLLIMLVSIFLMENKPLLEYRAGWTSLAQESFDRPTLDYISADAHGWVGYSQLGYRRTSGSP